MWPDKWVKLNLEFCERIPDMDFIFPTWIIDGCIQMIEEPYTDTDKLIYY